MTEYKINTIYEVRHPKPFSMDFHRHNYYELVLYKEGHGIIDVENSHYEYKKNSIVIIPSGLAHNEINITESNNLIISFSSKNQDVPTGHFSATPNMTELLNIMLEEYVSTREDSEEIVILELKALLLMLKRNSSSKIVKKDFSAILNNIDNYITDNISSPIRLNMFAHTYNYSPDRFRHIFTEYTGVSPKKYLILKRLEYSKKLLKTTKMSITDIAHECGFYDVSQFSKMFKSTFLKTPTQFKAEK